MSRRTERIASVIRGVVAEAIQTRLSDPRILPFTSVTRVEISPDLSIARVNVSVMAEEPKRSLCVQGLRHAAGRMRGMVAEYLTLRQIPRLEFHLDDSLRKSFETVQLLDRLMEGKRPQETGGPAVDGGNPAMDDGESAIAGDESAMDDEAADDAGQGGPAGAAGGMTMDATQETPER